MREKIVQLSFFDTYTDIADSMETGKPELVRLLEEYVDIESVIHVISIWLMIAVWVASVSILLKALSEPSSSNNCLA